MTKKQLPEKGSRWYYLSFGHRLEFEVTSVNEMYIGYKRLDNGKYFSAAVAAWPMNLKPAFKQPAVGSLWTVQLQNRTVHVCVEKSNDSDLVKTRYADGTPGNFTRDFWAAHATPIAEPPTKHAHNQRRVEPSDEWLKTHDNALDAVRYNLRLEAKLPTVGSTWCVREGGKRYDVCVLEVLSDNHVVMVQSQETLQTWRCSLNWWVANAIEEIPPRTAERDETSKPSAQQSNRSNTMKLIDTRTYVRGVDIKTMSEAVLLTTIESLEDEKKRIEPLVARSEALGKRTKALDDAINVLVEELASR